MQDYFIPEMRYTYTYTSPASYMNPIRWETTLAESGNVVALYDMATGKKWNDKDKTMFKNPYSQFVKLETDFTKTWTLNAASTLVGHLNAGIIYAYGNSDWLPNSEMFYVGGANSIRAFPVRGIGPGKFPGLGNSTLSYLLQNGDIKLVGNLEYRRQLFGSLHGAVFLDVGNVWQIDDIEGIKEEYSGHFRFREFLKQMAVGTGIGIRYDLDFLILRLDWGVALHVPYDTGKSGFYNIDSFKNSHTLHFAIGYPF
jgi:outer membrane protein assembly factor BamA